MLQKIKNCWKKVAKRSRIFKTLRIHIWRHRTHRGAMCKRATGNQLHPPAQTTATATNSNQSSPTSPNSLPSPAKDREELMGSHTLSVNKSLWVHFQKWSTPTTIAKKSRATDLNQSQCQFRRMKKKKLSTTRCTKSAATKTTSSTRSTKLPN